MEIQKFGISFKSKKKIESDCPFCQETFKTGENVILTINCCQNYIHTKCCQNWERNICPCCGIIKNELKYIIPKKIIYKIINDFKLKYDSESETESESDYSETESESDYSETEGMTEIELLEYNFKSDINNYLNTIEETEFYINSGANINIQNFYGESFLHLVKTPEQTKLLINAGANINLQNYYNDTPLHLVKTPEQTKILLEAGANPNLRNRNGQTPLHCANFKSVEQIKLLIEAGADLTIKNKHFYRTPEEQLYYDKFNLLTICDYLKKRKEYRKHKKGFFS